ncbi:MAG: sulfurtransferase TusA [Gilliamella sp.]|uniref:sulfurtransferase TusA n=1 Tax=Gilliamella TaxID=1193503 RepID=UPI00080EC302|nr:MULTISPECIES: sulfurtransferase TusA [Gilliamella]MCO6538413.1 sulfurtransferase TusA [Gilliamella sp.]MCO6540592.1 sulfurtransferase TusA [Gilliamella sp.]MCO6544861.1 sulfurtransferase TusA [Gilliamella sp.]MCO6548345.1 sulfurtransferase TusA [Gilliamella sp.]MCO6550852.1 sulfurtransferase TusA [Gilliamella sp.]
MNITIDKELNTLGLRCPEPIMLIRKAIRELSIGQVLYVIADDFATTRDVPSFCRHMDHQLLSLQIESQPYQYWIKKSH